MTMRSSILFLIALVLSLGSADHAFGQGFDPPAPGAPPLLRKIKIIVGYAQPLGSFADNDIFSPNSGYANPGGVLGVEYDHEIAEHYGFAFTVQGQFHSQNEKEWKKELYFFTYKTDVREVFSAMIGPFFDTRAPGGVVLFASPQLGAVYGNYPGITITDYTIQSLEVKADWQTTIGYRISAGAMWHRYDFGVQSGVSLPPADGGFPPGEKARQGGLLYRRVRHQLTLRRSERTDADEDNKSPPTFVYQSVHESMSELPLAH
jgi:hypothetical protein